MSPCCTSWTLRCGPSSSSAPHRTPQATTGFRELGRKRGQALQHCGCSEETDPKKSSAVVRLLDVMDAISTLLVSLLIPLFNSLTWKWEVAAGKTMLLYQQSGVHFHVSESGCAYPNIHHELSSFKSPTSDESELLPNAIPSCSFLYQCSLPGAPRPPKSPRTQCPVTTLCCPHGRESCNPKGSSQASKGTRTPTPIQFQTACGEMGGYMTPEPVFFPSRGAES